MEMREVTIIIPETFTIPVRLEKGKPATQVEIDMSKVHPTWLNFAVVYGLKQKVSDIHASAKGEEKLAGIRATVEKDLPNEFAGRTVAAQGSGGRDPIEVEMLKAAKADLVAIFKKAGFGTKVAQFAANEKSGAFFEDETWKDDVVMRWAESDKRDRNYRADAEAILEAREKATDDLDDVLGF